MNVRRRAGELSYISVPMPPFTVGHVAAEPGSVASGVLQVDTSAHLTHVGNQYYLSNGAGVGPSLKSDGAPVTDSQLGCRENRTRR